MKRALMISTVCLAVVAVTGCSSPVTQPDEYSGFLEDYSQLKPAKSPSGATVLRWIEPGLHLNRYTSVYIEPTRFYPAPQASDKIPQSTLMKINSDYYDALRRELGKSLPLSDAPGVGVISVRAAITAASRKTENLKPYEYIPVALVAAAVSTATGIRDQETTLATEVAFIDGGNQEVVAKLVRKGTGKPLENDSQVMKASDMTSVINGWATDIHQSYLKLKNQ